MKVYAAGDVVLLSFPDVLVNFDHIQFAKRFSAKNSTLLSFASGESVAVDIPFDRFKLEVAIALKEAYGGPAE